MLAKKKSRRITVNGIVYRWLLAPDNSIYGILKVQDEQANGQYLQVHLLLYNTQVEHQKITPSLVAKYIKEALVKGWKPTSKSAPFHLKVPHKMD